MIEGLENGEVVYNLLKLRVPRKPGPPGIWPKDPRERDDTRKPGNT